MENFNYKGVWFLPDNPERGMYGTLTFDFEKKSALEIIGSLNDDRSITHEPKIILGNTTDGKYITLYKCLEFSRSTSMPGMDITKYNATFIIVGHHFQKPEEIKFDTLTARLLNLDTWLSEFGFKELRHEFEEGKAKLDYELPKPIDFEINSERTGRFNFTYSAPLSKNFNKITIEQKAELIIKTKLNPVRLEDILTDMHHFEHFLTLGTYEAIYPISITLMNKDYYEEYDNKIIPLKFKLFYTPAFTSKSTERKVLWLFLFNYHDIREEFTDIVKKWYYLRTLIQPATNLLFESFYNPNTFNENKFLNIVHAIETFHRRLRNNEVLSKEQHEQRMQNILDSTDHIYKDWLQERLHFSNEPTLHQRLDEILITTKNKTTEKLIKDKNKFIKDVKNSRNYFTHYDKKLESKALKGGNLFFLTEKLKVVMICAIMAESNFKIELIEKLLSRNEFRFFNHILENDENTTNKVKSLINGK